MISICLVLLIALLANANVNNVSSTVRIYSNLAEIIRPLGKLPLEFTDEDWNDIRSDSFTLLGSDINISLQTITNEKKLLKGTEVYIRSPLSADNTNIRLIRGILVDENDHLVKIQDKSIALNRPIYLTVSSDKIYYVEEPTKPKHFVNFTYTSTKSKVFVSYLQTSLNWQTQYQLNLHDNESELIAMANIRNDAKSPIIIQNAELIGGDINLQKSSTQKSSLSSSRNHMITYAASHDSMSSSEPETTTVEQGKELSGLYIFPISKSLKINGKTNYLLPMFRPTVSVQRYGLISKSFSTMSNNGKAQRSYRLIPDQYLPQGVCILREQDRVVGETTIPNLGRNDKYEFSVGEDADICYKERAVLISTTHFNETETKSKAENEKSIVIIPRTRYIYELKVKIENFKNRPINLEYEQKGFYSYQTIKLTKSETHPFIQDGSSIKSNMTLKANSHENYLYTVELIR